MTKQYSVTDYGAVPGGEKLCTQAIQQAIDEAAKVQGEVLVPAGIYLTGALFLHSNMSLRFEKDAVLLGVTDEAEYPLTFSRVAGVEMEWPAGVINVIDAENVHIYGEGVIDGQGEFWWNKYWGQDRKGGMRADYEARGLRWAVDYDCLRVRNVIVFRCKNVTLEDFHSVRSGFWNVHLCYSENVEVRGLQIYNNRGPSTDGIDIDSCKGVLVEKCAISCSDDNICIKAGRDGDGLRVNRVCEDVVVQNCTMKRGGGVTLGSETSGGMRNIIIRDNFYEGTGCGFRMKSARTRGGVIENITVENLSLTNVRRVFSFEFDWNPSYSYCGVPEDYEGEVPERWKALTLPVPPERALPEAYGITVKNVKATTTEDCMRPTIAFEILGIPEKPFRNLHFENVEIQAKEFGVIRNVEALEFVNVNVTVEGREESLS